MTTLALAFDILARDRASRPIEQVGDKAEKTGGKLGGLGKQLGSFAKVGAAAFVGTAAAASAFAVKSASTFKSVGGEVLKLQRYTGATAEEASRLRFAAKQSGIDVDTMTKSLGLLSKNLAGTKLDKLKLGLKDASGHALPLNESLLKLADRFSEMPNGAEKTALAMQIFGKSGAQMLPFLNKGAAGIAELEKQTDKYGNVLTSGDLDAVKDATKNQRLFSAAMEGLQLQIGRYVLPIMTKFTSFLATNMPTAIAFVKGAMEKLAPTFSAVGSFIDKAVDGFRMFFNALTTGFTEDEGTPIEMLALTLRETLLPTIQKVGAFVSQNLKPILAGLAGAFILLTAPVTGVIAVAAALYLRFQAVRDGVAAVVGFFQGTVVPAFQTAATAIGNQFAQLQGWVDEHWSAIQEAIGHVIVAVQATIAAFVAAVSAAWRMWGDNIMTVVSTAFGVVQTVVQSVVGVISGVIETVINLINGDWGKAWDSFKGIVSSAWDGIKSIISGAVTVVVSLVSGIGEGVGRAASGMFDAIKTAFKGAINWIIEKWNGLEFKVEGKLPFPPHTKFSGTIGVPDIPLIAHTGGHLTSMGLKPLRSDEVLIKGQVGETIYPAGATPAAAAYDGPLIGTVNVMPYPGEDPVSALWRDVNHHRRAKLEVMTR